MKWLLVFLTALTPGLLSWWAGRRLLARREEPALAERYLAHNSRVLLLAFVVLIGVSVVLVFGQAPVLVGLIALVPLLSTLAGGFPLRRALYEESWGFFTYFSFMLRLFVAVPGFWVLLLLTPYVIQGAGDFKWAATAALGLGLVLWSRGYGAAMARLTEARPLADPDASLAACFARVDERASVEPPERLVVPVPGGRLVNALALPSKRHPRVLFSSSLLELLEPDEVGAIYAHEVGHLEYFQAGTRLRNLSLFVYAMIAAALAWGVVDGGGSFWAGFLWPVFFLALMRIKTQWTRGHETETDLRAVELFGDAEALIRGLERLHRLMLMPRRLAAEKESTMTHPSLARRLQAIRRAAGLDVNAEPTPAETPSRGDAPLFLHTRKPGEALLLEAERISFFDGVAADLGDAPPSFDELARGAAASHTQPYKRLRELRIEPRRGRHFLLMVDERGKKRRFGLLEEDVARLERRLDAIDVHLASTEDAGSLDVGTRLLAAIVAVAAILPPVTGGVAIPALFAALRPRPVSLVATGITGLAACVYRFLRVPAHFLEPVLTTTSSGLLGIVSLFLLVAGIRWARQTRNAALRGQDARLLAGVCWGLTLLEWATLFFMSRTGGSFDGFRANQLLFWSPSAFLFPLAAAVALFFVPRPRLL